MCPREDIDYQGSQLQELKADLESQLTAVKTELTDVKTELTKVKSDLDSKLVTVSRSLEEKLDAVLTKLGDKDMNSKHQFNSKRRLNHTNYILRNFKDL